MFEIMFQGFLSSFFEPVSFLVNPGKRIYWLYLIVSISFIFIAYRHSTTLLQIKIKKTLSIKYWTGRNSLLDMKWIFLNQGLAVFLLAPLLTGQVGWAMTIYRQMVSWFGAGDFIEWPYWQVMVLYTLVIFIVEDFTRFMVHYLYHKVPFLWRFHAIHHSATVMTPFTLYRIHFVEYVINSCRAVFVVGFISGVFIYVFNGAISLYEILGVGIFTFVFNLAGANLRHSHIWLGFGKYEQLFISPAQHQIHHSSALKHLDKNFGASLALWDKLFGTWLASEKEKVTKFGLYRQKNRQALKKQLLGIAPYKKGRS